MGLTNYALERMGFAEIPSDLVIEARFCSLNIYEVRGLVSDRASPLKPDELKCADNEIALSLGDSVNEICQVLLGENFVDEEEKWQSDTKTSPPYLAVLTQLDKAVACSGGYWKQEQEHIVTHDCFSDVKEALRNLENRRTSVAVAALSASLSSDQKAFFFIPIAREVFAETNLNKRLIDLRFQFSAEGYVSSPMATHIVSEKIASSKKLAKALHPKVGYFFMLAAKENDPLKKFLYLYLVIEIHTHQTFKDLDYCGALESLHVLPDRVASSAAAFYVERQKESKNLSQRFMWCSILRWAEIHDADIDAFKSIKGVRDRIYHGEEVNEKSLPIHQAQALALKLMRCSADA